LAFILGVVPLVIARGAGAASRWSLGTAVFGGMAAATALGVVIIPVLFVTIERLLARGRGPGPQDGRSSHRESQRPPIVPERGSYR
jgi:hypothetical protein